MCDYHLDSVCRIAILPFGSVFFLFSFFLSFLSSAHASAAFALSCMLVCVCGQALPFEAFFLRAKRFWVFSSFFLSLFFAR